MMTSFRMYYTLCPQSEIFELATVMKEQLLGDFSRKISILITCLLKHEMALSTDGTESVCGENAFTPLLFTLYFT